MIHLWVLCLIDIAFNCLRRFISLVYVFVCFPYRVNINTCPLLAIQLNVVVELPCGGSGQWVVFEVFNVVLLLLTILTGLFWSFFYGPVHSAVWFTAETTEVIRSLVFVHNLTYCLGSPFVRHLIAPYSYVAFHLPEMNCACRVFYALHDLLNQQEVPWLLKTCCIFTGYWDL